MLTENIQKALNDQIVNEIYAAHLYLSMQGYCEALSLKGCAKWLHQQYLEELSHAHKLFDYINERDGRVRLGAIKEPPNEWHAPSAIFQDAHRHEQAVSHQYGQLMALANKEDDQLTAEFLRWFLEEQVEEEDATKTIADRFKLAGDNPSALLLLDQELGRRE